MDIEGRRAWCRRDLCSAKALNKERPYSAPNPTFPSRRSARRCVLKSSPTTGAIEMENTEVTDETKTTDYIPGKLGFWELGLSFALFAGFH